MNDLDDQARAAGERVRRDAERIAATIEPLAPTTEAGYGRSSRWLLAAAAIVVTAGVGGLVVAGNRNSGVDTVSPPTDSYWSNTIYRPPRTSTAHVPPSSGWRPRNCSKRFDHSGFFTMKKSLSPPRRTGRVLPWPGWSPARVSRDGETTPPARLLNGYHRQPVPSYHNG